MTFKYTLLVVILETIAINIDLSTSKATLCISDNIKLTLSKTNCRKNKYAAKINESEVPLARIAQRMKCIWLHYATSVRV